MNADHQNLEDAELQALLLSATQGASESAKAIAPIIEELLRRNYDWIMRVCLVEFKNEQIALDCAQDVLITVSRKLASFRGDSKLSTWIYTILKRRISVYRRQLARERIFSETLQFLGLTNEPKLFSEDAEAKLLSAERRERLTSEIRKLSGFQRQAVIFYYLEDLSLLEAAERIGCSPSAMKTHLARARAKLKKSIERLGYEEE